MRPKATVTGLDEEMLTQRIFINEGNNMLLMRTNRTEKNLSAPPCDVI